MPLQSENVKSQMRKGILEYCILLCLRRQPAYATDIINALKKGMFTLVEGTLYPLLTRMKNNGLLTYTWAESNQGPPRKYYHLTDEGRIFLDDLECAWKEISNVVEFVKNNPINQTTLSNDKIINL
ncbi:MAG: PadR family transcriptional regulator [Candidatus Aphodosoma sp.]